MGILSRYIFSAELFEDKAMQICEFLNETKDLLNCPKFNKNRGQCQMCRRICRFREEVAIECA